MTMACRLHAEMDDQGKSLVSTLWCVVCRQYETRICGPKNFRAWTNSSSDHKTSNITDHANSEPHDTAMMYLCTVTSYCIYCTLLLYNLSMKCVRSTFCNGQSSYSVVWQSSGCYEFVIFIPPLVQQRPIAGVNRTPANRPFISCFQLSFIYFTSENQSVFSCSLWYDVCCAGQKFGDQNGIARPWVRLRGLLKPTSAFQVECPICLLKLHDPYIVSCCAKSYSEDCIKGVQLQSSHCPACTLPFTVFPNKGWNNP